MGSEWTSTTLGTVAEINPPRPKLANRADDTPVLFVPMAAVDDVTGEVTNPEERRLGDVRGKSYRTFGSDDVLFAKITPCMENGKAAVVPPLPSGLGFGSTEFHVLRARPGVSPRFLWHFVRQPNFRRVAQEHMTGSVGQMRVPAAFLESVPLAIPNLETQKKLVRTLDRTVHEARTAISHAAASTRKVASLREAILIAACAGRLTQSWRTANHVTPVGPAPAPSIASASHAGGTPNTDELMELPESWAWWPIESVTEQVIDYRGRTPPSEGSGPIPHVRTSQIRNGRVDWPAVDRFVTAEIYDAYMTRGIPRRGDVLFTMEAPMGEVAVIDRDEPFSLAQRILLLRPSYLVNGEFLALALRSLPVRRAIEYRATGSGVLGIAYKRLRSVLLPIPPIEEQALIVARSRELLKGAEMVQERIHAMTIAVERGSRSIVDRAFRGDLNLNGSQDPIASSAQEVGRHSK